MDIAFDWFAGTAEKLFSNARLCDWVGRASGLLFIGVMGCQRERRMANVLADDECFHAAIFLWLIVF